MWSPYLWIMLLTVCNPATGACDGQSVPGFQNRAACYKAATPISKALAFAKPEDVRLRVEVECVPIETREA